MKKGFIFFIFFLSVRISWGQNPTNCDKLKTEIDNLQTDDSKTTQLVTNKALNYFFNKKMSFFILGSEDISLSKAFFSANSEDGKLAFNYNVVSSSNNKYSFVQSVVTAGFETDISDGFATLLEGKAWGETLNLTAQYSLFFKGELGYYDPRDYVQNQNQQQQQQFQKRSLLGRKDDVPKDNLSGMRAVQYQTAEQICLEDIETKQEFDECFERRTDNYKTHTKKIEQTFQKFQEKLADAEVEQLKQANGYSSSHKVWLTARVSAPTYLSKYNEVIDSNTTRIQHVYPIDGALFFNGYYDKKILRSKSPLQNILFHWSIRGGLKNGNTFTAGFDTLKSVTLPESSLSTQAQEILGDEDIKVVYEGVYQQLLGLSFRPQITIYMGIENSLFNGFGIKISPEYTYYHSLEQNSRFSDVLSLTIGIPIQLSGEKEETPINIEPKFIFNDFENKLGDKKSLFSFGIALGIPFGNIIK